MIASRRIALFGLGAGLFAALVAGSFIAGASRATAVREEFEGRLAQQEEEVRQVRGQLARVESLNGLQASRASVYRAAIELDQRNFGTANDLLRQAEVELGQANPQSMGVDPQRWQDVRDELRQSSLVVAIDIQDQRARLVTLTDRLNTLLGQAAPK